MAEGDAELLDLYRDVLLDYFRSTSHKGKLPEAELRAVGANPLCGDECELDVALDGETIEKIRTAGHGCVISQSSVAMLAEILEGKTLSQAVESTDAFKRMMTGKLDPAALPEDLEETRALEGVRRFPVRIKCALLAWNTFLEGVKAHQAGRKATAYQEA